MAKTVFVSHAGADAPQAATVANLLTTSGVDVRYDRDELRLGDSFLAFMNSALTASDYCLLLWSRHAAATPWVQLEWEAALYRSVREKQSFLVTGRLEDIAVPALLGPRLHTDLFPDVRDGMTVLLNTWQADRKAEKLAGKPVAAALTAEPITSAPNTVYITSEQFAITVPVPVDLQEPAAVCAERCITQLKLPRQLNHESGIGVRFTYRLVHEDEVLTQAQSLQEQGIAAGAVLSLQTTMSTFSTTTPLTGAHSSMTFRAGERDERLQSLLLNAEDELRSSFASAGLLPGGKK